MVNTAPGDNAPDEKDPEDLSRKELVREVVELRCRNRELEQARDRVGLSFKRVPEDGNEAVQKMQEGQVPFLTRLPQLSIKKPGDPGANISLIEGENLAVLAALQMTHKGKVDVIYIDPPYNTGNGDFIYEDKRTYRSSDEELERAELNLDGKKPTVGSQDPYRHSKWLSFMERRLFLARELLSEDGVIFVSIDDHEQAYLKVLMDDVFGEANFVDTIMVELSGTTGMKVGAAKNGRIVKNGEFIHVYSKNQDRLHDIPRTPLYDAVSGYDIHYSMFMKEDGSLCNLSSMLSQELSEEFNAAGFPVRGETVSLAVLGDAMERSETIRRWVEENSERICRTYSATPYVRPDFSVEDGQHRRYETGSRHYFLSRDTKGEIIQLVPLDLNFRKADDRQGTYGRSVIRGDYWKGFSIDMGNISREGGVEFKNGKKPVRLIRQLLKWAVGAKKDALVFDFFAGSGTTGQAVAELNKEDGGVRPCILVTNNEANIARDVTHKRMSRILTGKDWTDGRDREPLPGTLSYFMLDFFEPSKLEISIVDELEEKFDGLLILENNVFDVLEEGDDECAVYQNDDDLILVWHDALTVGTEEFDTKLAGVEAAAEAKNLTAYLPTLVSDPALTPERWSTVLLPGGYLQNYRATISRMTSNGTLFGAI